MIKTLLKETTLYRYYINRKFDRDLKIEVEKNRLIKGPLFDKYLPKNSIGAELGVLKGSLSRVLLDFSNAKELHLIDPWYFFYPHWVWAGGNTSTVDAVCRILMENKEDINNKRIFVHIQDDLKVMKDFPDGYFDWVYIDTSHAYEQTKLELDLLKHKVKQSGVICGDDWRPDPLHRHHGVYKAVNEFMKAYDYELIYANDQNLQWFIKKR